MHRISVVAVFLAAGTALADQTIDNGEFGANIGPIGGVNGTDVYGQSFVCPEDAQLTAFGMWIGGGLDDPPAVRIDLWADDGLGHPDENNILVEGVVHKGNLPDLTRIDTETSFPIAAGETYWIVINGLIDQESTGLYSSTWDGGIDSVPSGHMDWSNDLGATWSGGIAGGDFGVYAELGPAGCPADCNEDGELTILDFICFQEQWQNQSAAGDCNGDEVYDILDFLCYQELFGQGCP